MNEPFAPRLAGVLAGTTCIIVWLGSVALGQHYLLAQALATRTVLALGCRPDRIWSFS